LAVSIHQNSYPDASVSGVQVFYYKDSAKSRDAAEILQTQLIRTLRPKKERVAKENGSYYLLKKTSVPIVIVECAFMSNPTEAALLTQDDYQEKVAWAIYMGIMQVIND
ncbi:MAG: N-acetylmuramoyl-L-alanine amidase, partial [Lachnospiraceae bacterium]|nr:N-acetylmuramoyl-L-alanine amidase [Lachnospiraceae bacterium]